MYDRTPFIRDSSVSTNFLLIIPFVSLLVAIAPTIVQYFQRAHDVYGTQHLLQSIIFRQTIVNFVRYVGCYIV